MDKEMENLDDHGCTKIKDFVDGKAEEIWIYSSYPFQHKTTLHWKERKGKLLGQWTMQHKEL